MNPSIREIIEVIEEKFPPAWQYDFDNSGWQILLPSAVSGFCTGVLFCVDVTQEIIEEAKEKGCNLIISHHPLIFRPLKNIIPENRVGKVVFAAINAGISIYACHTPCDVAPEGVSFKMAEKLGLNNVKLLSSHHQPGIGLGVIGDLSEPCSFETLVNKVKTTFNSPTARCSGLHTLGKYVNRIALGGGACSDLIPEAIRHNAQVFITSDVKHNLFLDYNQDIAVIDLGHYETEECTKEIFYNLLTKKFPNFALYCSISEKNPITYI